MRRRIQLFLGRSTLALVVAGGVGLAVEACGGGEPAASRDAAAPDAAVPDAGRPGTVVPVGDAGVPDASACGPGRRYTVITPPTPGCSSDGTGRVLDNGTGLTWMAKQYSSAQGDPETYCASQGMRLPTKVEALGIAGTPSVMGSPATGREMCAFPCTWSTWTSTTMGSLTWRVFDNGVNYAIGIGDDNYTVLCVQYASDAAGPDAAGPDAAGPDAAAGCGPGDRYAVVTAPSAGCSSDGTGRVLDTSTGLTWMTHPYFPSSGGQNQAQAETYCSGLGMRLPTKDEALGIAGTNRQTCAFPCGWVTWTSSLAGPGLAWRVSNGGGSEQRDVGYNVGTVLCVQ